MRPRVAIERWRLCLQRAIDSCPGPLRRVVVLEQTDSTQDAARRLDTEIGDVIVAVRQTAGRGRFGRAWADTGREGVAATFVVPRDRPERLAIAAAVGACQSVLAACRQRVEIGIKWPNDIVCAHGKIGGVLVEQYDDRALVGIGINVRQTSWPEDLAGKAASLAQVGARAGRMRVLVMLLQDMQRTLCMGDESLVMRFSAREVLTGTRAKFRSARRIVEGSVVRVDPMKGLAVLTDSEGEVWLPAATTTVIKE